MLMLSYLLIGVKGRQAPALAQEDSRRGALLRRHGIRSFRALFRGVLPLPELLHKLHRFAGGQVGEGERDADRRQAHFAVYGNNVQLR